MRGEGGSFPQKQAPGVPAEANASVGSLNQQLVDDEHKYVMGTFKRLPVSFVEGHGVTVTDDQGKDYLDLVGGIAVNLLGHSHPAVAEAVARQSARLIHVSNLYYSEPQVALAKRLVELSFPSRAFFCNSGAEANEAAIKIAHKWGKKHRDGAFEIITAEKSFHGRTPHALLLELFTEAGIGTMVTP